MTETSPVKQLPSRGSCQSFLNAVREACEMLLFAHPSVAEAVAVSCAFDNSGDARVAAGMAARLAEEYNLDIDVKADGTKVAVRVERDTAAHIHKELKHLHRVATARASVGGEIRR